VPVLRDGKALQGGRQPPRPRRRGRRCSPTTSEEIRHGRQAFVTAECDAKLGEPTLSLFQAQSGANARGTKSRYGDDCGGGFSMAQDEDLFSSVLRLVHNLREVSLHISERPALHMTNMTRRRLARKRLLFWPMPRRSPDSLSRRPAPVVHETGLRITPIKPSLPSLPDRRLSLKERAERSRSAAVVLPR
jgi:hypothetical protein